MNVREIVTEYLKTNGYSGLCDTDCGCSLDDLMPCDDCNFSNCEPGYKHECEQCNEKESCDMYDDRYTNNGCVRSVKQTTILPMSAK